ncbi:MAG: hypothetical protein R6V75_12040 [Bacteroidales bacterium]
MTTGMKSLVRMAPLLLLFGLGSCEKTDDHIIVVEENITEPTTWYSGHIYVIKAWDFYVLAELTIEQDVIVKFTEDGTTLSLSGEGSIMARGTADKPIIFTSYKDDDHGGDTNGDLDASAPGMGDWQKINTNGTDGSAFVYCHFLYGGKNQVATLSVSAGSVATVENCLFAFNDGTWSDEGALDCSYAGAGTLVRSNVFYGNIKALSINTAMSLDNSNRFHNPDNQSVVNAFQCIFVDTRDTDVDIRWEETEVALVINDTDLWLAATWTLGDGVVLKFMEHNQITYEIGLGSIENHNGTGVYFTSYKDDARLGDSNGDKGLTSPEEGDWRGIRDNATGNWFDWENILYDRH